MVNSWIGDGFSKPAATTADWMFSDRFKSVNFKVFFFLCEGGAKPPYETWLGSFLSTYILTVVN